LPETVYILFILLAFFASFISAVFGLGTALVVLTMGAYLLPTQQLMALSTVLFTTSTVVKSILFRQSVDWRLAAQITLLSLPFAYFGVQLMLATPPALLRQLLGTMVLLYLLLSYVVNTTSESLTIRSLLLGSAAYGFVSGYLGSGNIVKALVLQRIRLEKAAFVGIMAATSVFANMGKLTAFVQSGIYNAELYPIMLGLIIAALLSALLGKRGLEKLSQRRFQQGLHITLALCALGLLLGK